jgi:hypothetical protein
VTSPPDTSAPAGITWEAAMENAGVILADLKVERPKMGPPSEWYSARSSQAQAWIAFARELTMHTRATQQARSD